jgi:hypothetical protein
MEMKGYAQLDTKSKSVLEAVMNAFADKFDYLVNNTNIPSYGEKTNYAEDFEKYQYYQFFIPLIKDSKPNLFYNPTYFLSQIKVKNKLNWKKDFEDDFKIFLTFDGERSKYEKSADQTYILICNNQKGWWLNLNQYFHQDTKRSDFIKDLTSWTGYAKPTRENWGLEYLYDITDVFVSDLDFDFINWPKQKPQGLI